MPSFSTILAILATLTLVTHTEAGAVDEIGLIKKLLTTIFDRWSVVLVLEVLARYKSDMASLQGVVELATGDLRGWREEVGRRLRDLELILGTRSRHQQVQEQVQVQVQVQDLHCRCRCRCL